MARRHKHVHKYYKLKTGLWHCALPDCYHYMPRNVEDQVEGRHSVCWQCGVVFKLDSMNMKEDMPICFDCSDGGRIGAFITEKTGFQCLECHKKYIPNSGDVYLLCNECRNKPLVDLNRMKRMHIRPPWSDEERKKFMESQIVTVPEPDVPSTDDRPVSEYLPTDEERALLVAESVVQEPVVPEPIEPESLRRTPEQKKAYDELMKELQTLRDAGKL